MNQGEIAYQVETDKNFEAAVISVLQAIERKGWSIFQIYDISERLKAKGFAHQPVKIIEFCSAKYADEFLGKNRLSAICLPCKIVVLSEMDKVKKVKIVVMKPIILSQLFPEISREEASEAEKEIEEIISQAA